MKKTTAIRTTAEKVAFIAENMELTFDRVLDDFDINWFCTLECKCYVVEDAANGEIIYTYYDEACVVYNDIVDEIKNALDVMVGTKVTISEVDIRFYEYIKSSELDTATLSDFFDNFVLAKNENTSTKKLIAIAEVTNDGIVER